MNLLFEEDGAFKAGSVLSATDASFQVELPSGRRSKVKASHVLLRFEQPAPSRLLEAAEQEAAGIDLDFLWEAAPQEEFDFTALAADYFGAQPTAVQQAALLLRLHGAPVYFHRKGRGRFRPAPPDTLKAALAAVERKRRQEEERQRYVDELKAGRTPAAIAERAVALLVRPDRSTIEVRALEQAAAERQTTPLRLLLANGAIASEYDWHVQSFLAQHFPRGAGFGEMPPAPETPQLPLAEVAAFSIDDSATTEIDDAFSVTPLAHGRVRVGVHIAAPALALDRAHALDAVARARWSTVYAPGLKYTMLPPAWVEAYTLAAGREVPVLSLYLDVDTADHTVHAQATRVERVRIAANLRHDELDAVVTDATITAGAFDAPFARELSLLWRLARALLARREAVRGRPEPVGRIETSFELEGDGADARVRLKQRTRGAPLDLLVAELMILTNSTWGRWLAESGVAGIYRSQSLGRVRMSTAPGAHEGMGVSHYAWSSSPLRRYVDLVNQRQLLALATGAPSPYAANDAELFAVVSGFDAAYTAYAEFQERMERYWTLRWLQQEGITRQTATVLRGDVLRLAGLPFVTRLPGLPELPRGQQLELEILGSDELDLTLQARVQRLLAATAALDDEEDAAEPSAEAPMQPGRPAADAAASAPPDAPGADAIA